MPGVPHGLSLPKECPRCGNEWSGFAWSESDPEKISLACVDHCQHHEEYRLTADDVRLFRVALRPELSIEVALWVIGGDKPLLTGVSLPTSIAKVGEPLNVLMKRYVIDSIEVDRVWLNEAPIRLQ